MSKGKGFWRSLFGKDDSEAQDKTEESMNGKETQGLAEEKMNEESIPESDQETPQEDSLISETDDIHLSNANHSPEDFLISKTDDYMDDDSPLITCPHCWNEFHLSQINYIASHPSLIGDTVLGESEQIRFLPNKFNAQGYAIDAKGMVCRDMACPRCHLKIPEIVLDEKMDILSIVGAPASGKSYYITALMNMVKKNLPKYFGYSFSDADVSMNYMLNHYEDILFHNGSDEMVSLPKTELEGANFSSQVRLQGVTVNLPLPYIYTIRKTHDNSSANQKGAMHNVIMYDNAGEHFEAGRDNVTNLATMHLINSSIILFLFDPFKDSKAIGDCNRNDPQAGVALRSINQGQILHEMINRIKKFRGMASFEKSDKTLVVLVPKYDAWANSFPFDMKSSSFVYFNKSTLQYSLDLSIIKCVSYCTRQWLLERASEIVTDSEAFFENVYFLPVSALGTSPDYDEARNMIGVKPSKIDPIWVDVPMYLHLWKCGLVPAVKNTLNLDAMDVEGSFKDDSFIFMDGKSNFPRIIPSLYWGECVYDMFLGKYLRFPKRPEGLVEDNLKKTNNDDFWN